MTPVPVTQGVTASVSAPLWPPMPRPAMKWECVCPGGHQTSAHCSVTTTTQRVSVSGTTSRVGPPACVPARTLLDSAYKISVVWKDAIPSAHQQPPSLMRAQCSVYPTVQSPSPAASMESCTGQVHQYLQTKTAIPASARRVVCAVPTMLVPVSVPTTGNSSILGRSSTTQQMA